MNNFSDKSELISNHFSSIVNSVDKEDQPGLIFCLLNHVLTEYIEDEDEQASWAKFVESRWNLQKNRLKKEWEALKSIASTQQIASYEAQMKNDSNPAVAFNTITQLFMKLRHLQEQRHQWQVKIQQYKSRWPLLLGWATTDDEIDFFKYTQPNCYLVQDSYKLIDNLLSDLEIARQTDLNDLETVTKQLNTHVQTAKKLRQNLINNNEEGIASAIHENKLNNAEDLCSEIFCTFKSEQKIHENFSSQNIVRSRIKYVKYIDEQINKQLKLAYKSLDEKKKNPSNLHLALTDLLTKANNRIERYKYGCLFSKTASKQHKTHDLIVSLETYQKKSEYLKTKEDIIALKKELRSLIETFEQSTKRPWLHFMCFLGGDTTKREKVYIQQCKDVIDSIKAPEDNSDRNNASNSMSLS